MSIGTSWAAGTWTETSWIDGSWGVEAIDITGTIAVTAFAARCALLGTLGARRVNARRLTAVRDEIPIPAEQPEEVQASVRAAQYRIDHTSTRVRIPLPAKAEPTVQQSIRAIRKRLERLP